MNKVREFAKSLLERASPSTLAALRQPRVGLDNNANRVRWIESTLKNLPSGLRLLDAGAGEQPYRQSCDHLRYVAQDFAEYDGKGDGRGLQMGKWDQTKLDLICDISCIPEPDASFDVILCTEVIEHVTEPLAVLREFARLLRPGGTLILTAPFISFTHFAPYHYHTGFSRYFYEHHLATHGLQIKELTFNGNFFELIAQEVRRIPWAAERYADRKLRGWENCVISLVVRILGHLGHADHGSAEFAAFGIHLVAVKASAPLCPTFL